MRVLFVYPKPSQTKDIRFGFSMNIAYGSALLKKHDIQTYFIDCSCSNVNVDDIVLYVQEKHIDIVAVEFDSFSLKRSMNVESGMDVLQKLRETCPDVINIAFGYGCMIDKKDYDFADITIKNDVLENVESVILSLMRSYDNVLMQGDFDNLPYPDRQLIETCKYYGQNRHSTLIQTSKGCLNSCKFCQRRGWNNGYQVHSIEYTLNEFRILNQRDYHNIWIVDENFTFDLKRSKALLSRIHNSGLSKDMNIAISSWSKIDEEFLFLAAQANVKTISMGVESANETVLKFYDKDIDLMHVSKLIDVADKLGIFTVGNFIIGAPFETEDMIANTFKYIMENNFDQINIKILDYMVGSRLYSELPDQFTDRHYFCCRDNGLGRISLNRLKYIKMNFQEMFKKHNSERLKHKILKFGLPYEPLVRPGETL